MHLCMYVRVCIHVCVSVCIFVRMYVCMWQRKSSNLQPRDLVLLREDNTTPLYWPTPVITDIHPRANSIILVVTLRNSKGISNVPLQNFASCRMQIVNDNHLFAVGSMFMLEIKLLY